MRIINENFYIITDEDISSIIEKIPFEKGSIVRLPESTIIVLRDEIRETNEFKQEKLYKEWLKGIKNKKRR